ncbi:unnamed protein product [Leptosia nina]|uniref:Uncharacterized protein n=1 Tax=Leptosia nina TaxID=320188 RepID=A0AAV1JP98_9NEOP
MAAARHCRAGAPSSPLLDTDAGKYLGVTSAGFARKHDRAAGPPTAPSCGHSSSPIAELPSRFRLSAPPTAPPGTASVNLPGKPRAVQHKHSTIVDRRYVRNATIARDLRQESLEPSSKDCDADVRPCRPSLPHLRESRDPRPPDHRRAFPRSSFARAATELTPVLQDILGRGAIRTRFKRRSSAGYVSLGLPRGYRGSHLAGLRAESVAPRAPKPPITTPHLHGRPDIGPYNGPHTRHPRKHWSAKGIPTPLRAGGKTHCVIQSFNYAGHRNLVN